MIWDGLVALDLRREGAESLIEPKRMCGENKAKPETLLEASENKLSDSKHRVKEIELSKNTVVQLETMLDETE